MSVLFCCDGIKPYRPKVILHEAKFTSFMAWAAFPREASPITADDSVMTPFDATKATPPFAVQLVRQVNYGPLEFKRYFVPVEGKEDEFVEVTEQDLIQANFQKLNSQVARSSFQESHNNRNRSKRANKY